MIERIDVQRPATRAGFFAHAQLTIWDAFQHIHCVYAKTFYWLHIILENALDNM